VTLYEVANSPSAIPTESGVDYVSREAAEATTIYPVATGDNGVTEYEAVHVETRLVYHYSTTTFTAFPTARKLYTGAKTLAYCDNRLLNETCPT